MSAAAPMEEAGEASECKLVILGLPWATTQQSLEAYFSQLGNVTKAVIMKDHLSGRSRGFGFVTFGSKAEAERVVSMSHELDGRRIEAKVALPKGDTPRVEGTGVAGTTRIFVARIPVEVTDEAFRKYFEQFGEIQDSYMPKDHVTREHRGIGFVTFGSPDAVDRVMADSHQLGGTTVAIDRATPKDDGGGRKGPMGGGMGGRGGPGRGQAGGYNRGGSGFGGGNMGYANPAGYNMGAGGYGRGNAMYGQGAPGMAPYNQWSGGMVDIYGMGA
eukprot:CAMPEP_0118934736 /NCGR_PEP_ID=MMETSP1169-20130426/14024_1 /TAXON_ID=36882 /ORGANISM="Pyramimonas obovata, Strain CCMP722" /LENGTH=272 /DNA_ID=CAMNT_0006877669 /DNA_START=122 /DNA_END=936 /DNA_ORIENTATION=-